MTSVFFLYFLVLGIWGKVTFYIGGYKLITFFILKPTNSKVNVYFNTLAVCKRL